MTYFNWNDETEAVLIEAAENSKTASQIVVLLYDRFGDAPTRNAVCGKIDRFRKAGKLPPTSDADKSAHARKNGKANSVAAKAKRMSAAARKGAKTKKRSPVPKGEHAVARTNGFAFSKKGNHKPLTSERLAEIGEMKRKEEIAARKDAGPEPNPARPYRRSVLDLGPRDCKWPHGTPGHKDFHFCGRKREPGVPYCAYHQKISKAPNQPKPNVRAPKGSNTGHKVREPREDREPALDAIFAEA